MTTFGELCLILGISLLVVLVAAAFYDPEGVIGLPGRLLLDFFLFCILSFIVQGIGNFISELFRRSRLSYF
jgi:hypothetical protein